MSPDLVLKVLKVYGFPTLVAIALGFYVWHLDVQAARDRNAYTQFLWAQMNDIQIDLHTLNTACTKR